MSTHIHIHYTAPSQGEMFIQGSPEVVAQFLRSFIGNENLDLSYFQITEAPKEHINTNVVNLQPNDKDSFPSLLEFYRLVAPQNQAEQILTITYYYMNYKNADSLLVDDYQAAYDLLKRIPVKKPTNINSSIQNVISRSDYLLNIDRRKYILTLKGEEYIKELLDNRSKSSTYAL